GLIPFTRYAGIAMLASGSLSIFFLTSGKLWSRIKKVTLFALIGSLPTLLWFIRVYFVNNHSVGGRDLGINWGILAVKFQLFRGTFMDTVWKWIPFQSSTTPLPYSVRFVLMGIGLITILVLSFLAKRQIYKNTEESDQKSDTSVFVYFGLSSLTYLAFLIVSYLFILPTIAIDNRTLLPLFVGIVMGLLGAFALWQTAWFRERKRLLQILSWLVGILCVYWYLPQVREKAEFYHQGDGLTAYHWNRSEVIQAVRSLPTDTPVISNDWELVLLWTQRPIFGFWNTFPSDLPDQITSYGSNPGDHVQSIFCDQGAALVIFNDFPTQFIDNIGETAPIKISELFAGLSIYGTFPDGTIYFCH
ncbi:MAG: hypothetical protein NTV38_00370, partial [Chloroflexi bacterium]|nr:hypothetical protein [Chloroflexota bacterium]